MRFWREARKFSGRLSWWMKPVWEEPTEPRKWIRFFDQGGIFGRVLLCQPAWSLREIKWKRKSWERRRRRTFFSFLSFLNEGHFFFSFLLPAFWINNVYSINGWTEGGAARENDSSNSLSSLSLFVNNPTSFRFQALGSLFFLRLPSPPFLPSISYCWITNIRTVCCKCRWGQAKYKKKGNIFLRSS